MGNKTFRKILSANDVGGTGGHQAGILVPKSEGELLDFFPSLNPEVKNPSSWIECVDEEGESWEFRYVYYNNKLHDENGTRNEYRITHMTKFLRQSGAREGDAVELSGEQVGSTYRIRVVRDEQGSSQGAAGSTANRIKLKGWRRVH